MGCSVLLAALWHELSFLKLFPQREYVLSLQFVTTGSIAVFKKSIRERFPADKGPMTITMANTLGECVDVMAEARKHRLFVVDGTGKPLKVITQRDVLRSILGAAHAGAA